MTKSQPSAIKLRLSRLVRCLVALCCLKLVIMGAALFDLPMPAWSEKHESENAPVAESRTQEHSAVAENIVLAPVEQKEPTPAPIASEEMPQGSAAAELAALAKPRKSPETANASLPAPLVAAVPASKMSPAPHSYISPQMPEPPSLGAPLVAAGVIIPKADDAPRQDSGWNMFDIKSLPIPGLGSAQAAHAAALDMPVPNTPEPKSPFAPADQLKPAPLVVPGAPALPQNLSTPSEQPTQDGSIANAPAPTIQPRQSSLDPNAKAQELARQQQDILMLREQMDQRLKDLKSAEDKMQTMIKEAKEIEDQKVKSLVQMYANMKPRMAAQALENMDERVAVRILSGMAPKQSGEIMTYTNPVKTARFTEMITRMRMAQ